MTSIKTPEAASAFGCLDGDALVDGGALDAHALRTIATQANWLIRKPQILLNLVWPTGDYSYSGDRMSKLASLKIPVERHTHLLPPLTIAQKPGTRSITIAILSSHSLGIDLELRAKTIEDPWGVSAVVTGTGAAQKTTLSVATGTREPEVVTVELRAVNDVGGLMDTGTYGNPNTATPNHWGVYFIHDTSANWATGPTGVAAAGHYVVAKDSNGNAIIVRDIATNDSDNIRWLAPAQGEYPIDTYEIRQRPVFNLFQVLILSDERPIP